MEEKEIDRIAAYTLDVGDIIRDSDGFIVEIVSVSDLDTGIVLVTERGEEEPLHPDLIVPIYGYPED